MGFFQDISNTFRDFKNSKLSDFAVNFMNGHISDFGRVVNFRIDSSNKRIHLDVSLKGESQNMSVRIERYQVVHFQWGSYIKFENIFISREWVEKLVRSVVIPKVAPGNMFKVESMHARIFDLLV